MQADLRIAIWNANGLSRHTLETEIFLKDNFIDIMLISETHFTDKTFFNIRNYDLIATNHPSNRAHAGCAVLVKSNIKYDVLEPTQTLSIQAAGVKLNCNNIDLHIYALYSPPRHSITTSEYDNFFNSLGNRFLVGGDYNAKHPWWGSRIPNPKGRELYKCITKNNFKTLSTGEPTYWPSDPNKIPDLLDFAVYKGIQTPLLDIASSEELSSDHSPVIISYSTLINTKQPKYMGLNNKNQINIFQNQITENVELKTSIKSSAELDNAVETFTLLIHQAVSASTIENRANFTPRRRACVHVSADIRALIQQKRKLRKKWQNTRSPADKTLLNRATSELKDKLKEFRNKSISDYIENLNDNRNDDYKIWKATKYLKRPKKRNVPIKDCNDAWCRSDTRKAKAYAKHLETTFTPNTISNSNDSDVLQFLDAPCQLSLPIKHITPAEICIEIEKLDKNKSPGYDKIDAKIVKCLPKKGIMFLTLIYNSILRLSHFPTQWKCAEIVMVCKPNKPENEISSYRPISLLALFSKIFERIFLRRISPILKENNIIPEHQFGFRRHHGTPEQCHRVVNFIIDSFERREYCSAVFLDIQQAFDKVWHHGLLYKIKKIFPSPIYLILKSYLANRSYYLKVNDETSTITYIKAGVPQGSVLGPVLYTIFTSDMPQTENVFIATYADDTAIMASNQSPIEASNLVQKQLDKIQSWLDRWKIKVNTNKSVHVLFTLRRNDCPPCHMYGSTIPKLNSVKYLGLHLDKRLTWKCHIQAKNKLLKMKTKKLYWLLGPKSTLYLETKLLLYKALLKPVWTYGIQLWGTASNSNIEILQRFQSKTLRLITNAPWYITNKAIHSDLNIPFIKNEINRFSTTYLRRISYHENLLAITLLDETNETIRLKRHHVLDLPFRN